MSQIVTDSGKDWPQIMAIIVACIPGLTSAMLFSWPSPFILVLTKDKENYDISEEEANLLPVLHSVSIICTSVFFFNIHDKIGRKYTLLVLTIPQTAFWIITIFARDIYTFYIARIIGGVSDALMYAALPIYMGEVASPRVRGTWGNGQTFSFNMGYFLINLIGSYLTIQQTSYIVLTLPILFVSLLVWIPESPYYYIMKGKDDKARQSLEWLLRKRDIEPDFTQLKKDVHRQISETGKWTDLFRIRSNRKALIACIFIRFGQQLAGIAVFETYIQYIFEKSGSGGFSPQVSSMIFSGLLWIVMSGFTITLDKFGRRKSFIYSSLGCAILLLLESIYFYLEEFHVELDLSKIKWFPLAVLVVYIFFFAGGLGILPSLMAGELFSASIKGKALCVSNIAMGGIGAASMFLFKIMNSSIGLYAPFLLFSVCTFVSFGLSFYIVPETKGKTLEEIQQDFKAKEKCVKIPR